MTIGRLIKRVASSGSPVFKDVLLARQKMDYRGLEGKERGYLGSYINRLDKRIGWLRLEVWRDISGHI